MQRGFRRILSAVRETYLVSYARIITIGGFSHVDLIVIRATAPNDSPLAEKYVQELLKIFAFSPPSFEAFSMSFSRRFCNTRCWRVGLKCLVLLHRLLHSVPENCAFRVELLRSRAKGSMSLDQSYFRDDSLMNSGDHDSFVRSYAQLLDEALNCYSFYKHNAALDSGDEANRTISSKIDEMNRALETLPQIQSLIDRIIDCRPTGKAAQSIAVWSAMKHILRESFICYRNFCTDIVPVREDLLEMPYRSCITAIGIYKKAAAQADKLTELYDWCKRIGVCGLHEFPVVDRIPPAGIQTLEAAIVRMWQLTESSSFSSTTPTSKSSPPESPPYPDNDSANKVATKPGAAVISTEWEIFEDDDFLVKSGEKRKPWIEFEVSLDSSWEDLLEASASLTLNLMNCNFNSCSWEQNEDGSDDRKMQMYNSNSVSPFHHECISTNA